MIGYAFYTYWPILSPYFGKGGMKGPITAKMPEIKPEKPAAAPSALKKAAEETKAVIEEMFREEEPKKLVDPFSVRIMVVSRSEDEARRARLAELKTETGEPREVEPKLEGVWVGAGLKAAFISGQLVTEGGMVMGWTLIQINKTGVVLRKGSAIKTLKLEVVQ
jgi:hypothetical protein